MNIAHFGEVSGKLRLLTWRCGVASDDPMVENGMFRVEGQSVRAAQQPASEKHQEFGSWQKISEPSLSGSKVRCVCPPQSIPVVENQTVTLVGVARGMPRISNSTGNNTVQSCIISQASGASPMG